MRVARQLLLTPHKKDLVEEFFNTTNVKDMTKVKPLFEKQVDRLNGNISMTAGFYFFGLTIVGPVFFETFLIGSPVYLVPVSLSFGATISPFVYKKHFYRKIVEQIEIEEAVEEKKD